MALSKRVVYKRRATITELPLYHSGLIVKKHNKDKDFKVCFGEIRGSTLFMYDNETQDTYTDKVDLKFLKCMTTEYTKWTSSAIFTLNLERDTLQIKIDNADRAEEWRGVILTVANKNIPKTLKLLPGQVMKLEEILGQELKRQAPPPLPPRPSFLAQQTSALCTPSPLNEPEQILSDIPPCFYNVTRQQAEQMLQDNPEYGSIILRPSAHAKNYAVTLRQLSPRRILGRSKIDPDAIGPVIKNYRVTAIMSGFVIELDSPVEVESLEQVLQYIIVQTEHRLQPYMKSQPYDTRIEMTPVPKCKPNSTSPTGRVLPQALVAPMVCNPGQQETLHPSRRENDYVIPCEKIINQENVKDTLHQILEDANFSSC